MKVFLLGTCRITVDDKEVNLPYKKSLALFIYLLEKKTCLRDDIVHLFWGDMNENLAKKNLRNAVYTLRKHLGKEIIVSPKRELLSINIDMIKEIDYQNIADIDTAKLLNMKDSTYAKGLYFNDAPYMELWLEEMRQQIREELSSKYLVAYNSMMSEKHYDKAEELAHWMIERDEYNEQGYRLLFEALRRQGKYSSVISMYNKLCSRLNDELMLKPDDDTRQLYEEIMGEKVSASSPRPDNLFGRDEIINSLIANVYTNMRTNIGKSIILTGESGIGKSTIVDAFAKSIPPKVRCITVRCYEAEKNYMLSPWFPIVKELLGYAEELNVKNKIEGFDALKKMVMGIVKPSDENGKQFINLHQIENIVRDVCNALKDRINIIIYFDDVQWLDDLSIKLISDLEGTNIMFVMTFNTELSSLKSFKYNFRHHRYFEKIDVPPLNRIYGYQMIRHIGGAMHLSDKEIDQILDRSQGNPLFISELINASYRGADRNTLPNRITDIMGIRYDMLQNDEKKILHMASHFYDYFYYEDIKAITGADDFSLFEPLTNLTINKILIEDRNRKGAPIFRFSHQLMRAFIYNQVPESLRRIYHQKIGLYIEKQAKGDYRYFTCIRLIHHFAISGERLKEMNYRLVLISNYLNKNHEMFPIINRSIDEASSIENLGNDDEVKYELDKIISLYNNMQFSFSSDPYEQDTLLNYWYLIGRHNIVSGDEKLAIECIEKLIINAESINNTDYLMKGYILKSYYHINRWEPVKLKQSLEKADIMAKASEDKGIVGVLNRLCGFSDILNGDIEAGFERIETALEIFNTIEDKENYLLNIVGCHYYTGEGHRLKGDYLKAITYYTIAIDLCIEKGFENKLAFLYGARGQCYYELGEFDKSEEDIITSLDAYDKSPKVWGRIVTKAYQALICLEGKRYEEVIEIMKSIDESIENIFNCYYKVVVFRVKSEICFRMPNSNIGALDEFCPIVGKKFCKEMLEILESNSYKQEDKLIQKTKNNCLLCINK